jgi:hypothetical protein
MKKRILLVASAMLVGAHVLTAIAELLPPD